MSALRESSKATWNSNESIEHINAGSLQRIADATELMARNHQQLVYDAEQYKRWYYAEKERVTRRDYRIRALLGVITKLRKAMKGGER